LLEKFFPGEWNPGRRKLVVYIDEAIDHKSRTAQDFLGQNSLKRPPHSPYSPDISPSDFYLSGKVKSTLIGREIPDEIDFLETITEILNCILDAEMQHVIRSWIDSIEKVIDTEWDHLTLEIFSPSLSYSRSAHL
jgi:histone-lysine N-methyltransferase SETMAR